jgi:nicotinamidase-related amidase
MPRVPARLEKKKCLLVLVDVQERFRGLIDGMDGVVRNSARLLRFCDRLDIPVVVTEQYPQRLGRTVPELAALAPGAVPYEKLTFSCAGDRRFMGRLQSLGRSQAILCGIEAHVCVYQTVFDLLALDWQVAVAADAVSSRRPAERDLGLARMRELGAQVMGAEMIMFEILREAGTPDFKAVADVLKG